MMAIGGGGRVQERVSCAWGERRGKLAAHPASTTPQTSNPKLTGT